MDFRDLIVSLNTETIFPEGVLIVSLLLTVLIDLVSEKKKEGFSQQLVPWIPVLGFLVCLGILAFQWFEGTTLETASFLDNQQMAFVGSFQADSMSIVFRLLIALSGLLCLLLSFEYIEQSGTALVEFIALFVTATVGGMLLAGTNDLVTLFVAIETLGLSSYLLTGYLKQDLRSNEAALKYLLIGGASSALLLYGLSWVYGLSGGHLELNYLIASLVSTDFAQSLPCWVAFLFITAGIAFKISAAPFHQWTPDVYQGAPTPVVAFLSVSSKAAGLALATRVLAILFPYLGAPWHFVFEVLAILSMLIGNFVAITQTSFKRMLGYSSIGQAGYLLIGLLTGYEDGYTSMLVYILIYLFMNLGAFAGVIFVGFKKGTDQIQDYGGLFQEYPLVASCLTVSLLSLAGIPPLAGFFGKIYLFWAGWKAGFEVLIFIGLITSVVSIYYYLRVVKIMFIGERPQDFQENIESLVFNDGFNESEQAQGTALAIHPSELALGFSVFGTMTLGIFINPVIQIAQTSVFFTPAIQQYINQGSNLAF